MTLLYSSVGGVLQQPGSDLQETRVFSSYHACLRVKRDFWLQGVESSSPDDCSLSCDRATCVACRYWSGGGIS